MEETRQRYIQWEATTGVEIVTSRLTCAEGSTDDGAGTAWGLWMRWNVDLDGRIVVVAGMNGCVRRDRIYCRAVGIAMTEEQVNKN